MSLNELYKETILDHYQSPRNRGRLTEPDVANRGNNPLCGDELDLTIKIEDGVIAEIAFTGRGCSISQASASMMTEAVKGRSLAEVEEVYQAVKEMMLGSGSTEGLDSDEALGDLLALQGIKQFPVRVKCAVLAWNTLKEGLELYRTRELGPAGCSPSASSEDQEG